MVKERERRFSREFKLAALGRMLAGENVSGLARELGIRRKYLYEWRKRFRQGGSVALRSRGRPTAEEALAIRAHAGGSTPVDALSPDALARAERRIAELERKIGQQQVELDFFQRALRQVGELRQRSGVSGGTASTRSSKR